MLKFLLPLAFLTVVNSSSAGELTYNATITKVASTNGNIAGFAIFITGGTGACTGWITFPENKAASPSVYKQQFANALLAYSMGKRVRIHNYHDDNCSAANFIEVGD